MSDRTWVDQQVAEDAAEWFARLETERPAEATRLEFVGWLTRSPVHVEEFLRVSALHRALSRELQAKPGWRADLLTEADAASDNVIWLADAEPCSTQQAAVAAATSQRRSNAIRAAAATVILAVGIGAVLGIRSFVLSGEDGGRFTTAIGEQRRVVLPDGSGVRLNTDTEIQFRSSDAARQVVLVRGEAIFDVEKDPVRPFRVKSDAALMEAIGTRFKVHRRRQRTVITVLEGRVAVSPLPTESRPPGGTPSIGVGRSLEPAVANGRSPGEDRSEPVHLDAGLEVTVTKSGEVAHPAAADIDRATAWTRGRMVFDADTLDTVVAEFNRYNRERLVLADPALSDRRITGVFNIDDPEAFLALLTDLDDVRVERRGDGSREIRRKPAFRWKPAIE